MIERITRLICDNCDTESPPIAGRMQVRPEFRRRYPNWHLWNDVDLCPDCWDKHVTWSRRERMELMTKAHMRAIGDASVCIDRTGQHRCWNRAVKGSELCQQHIEIAKGRCRALMGDGSRCSRSALPAMDYCKTHAGGRIVGEPGPEVFRL